MTTDSGQHSVLVTGGAGYLGRLTVAALADAGLQHLVSLDIREPQRREQGVRYVADDVRTGRLPGLLEEHGVDAVVHLAAVVNPPAGMSDATLHAIEVGGTEHVLASCVEAGVRHVTVTSSGAAYGYRLANRGRLLTEDDPVPGSDEFAYSRHKAEVEALLAKYRRIHPELGQLVLRPGTILGEDTSNQITNLFEQRVVLGLKGVDVPFVFVWDHDVVEVIVRGVTSGITGTYNLAGDGVLTLADLAAIEGRPLVRLPVGVVSGALGVLGRFGLTQYGPEQVDFLRYRPVLANDALKRTFPGLPRRTTREAYETYRRGRRRRETEHRHGTSDA